MKRKQLVFAVVVILLIAVVLATSVEAFLATAPANEITYNAPASTVRVSLGKTARSDTISLRLNGIINTSNRATQDMWVTLTLESEVYNISLTPLLASVTVIANVTMTNVQPTDVDFSYTAFALLTPNNTAYYANYAVCSASCSQALKKPPLSGAFTSDLYVLFAVPTGTDVEKVAYTTSDPVIVMSADESVVGNSSPSIRQ